MGDSPRIRWENVAKLGAGGVACLALAAGLPALLRRPEPPPLESDIGFAPAAAPVPSSDGLGGRGGDRRGGSGRGHEDGDPGKRSSLHERSRQPRPPRRATSANGIDRPGAPAPRSAPRPSAPAPTVEVASRPSSPPAPVAPPRPPAPPPAPAPPQPDPTEPPSRPSEFGFER